MCVYVCVNEREREGGRHRERETDRKIDIHKRQIER